MEEMNETGFVLDFLQILIPNKAPLLLLSKGLVFLAWSQKYAKVTMLLVVWAWSISLNIDSVSSSTLAKPVHVYPMQEMSIDPFERAAVNIQQKHQGMGEP